MSLPFKYTLLNPFHKILGHIGSAWIGLRYYKAYHKPINRKHPSSYHEKIIWLMNNTDISQWTELADKYKVREFITRKVGEHLLPKLYGVWDRPEEIDFSKITIPCVFKTNNGCTTNVFVRSQEDLNPDNIKSELNKYLSIHYGELTGEKHYVGIKPKIICEELMIDQNTTGKSLTDYKFHCFNGEPLLCEILADRQPNTHLYKQLICDMDFNPKSEYLDFSGMEVGPITNPRKPACWEHMKAVARTLCQGFPYVRVDLYDINNHTKFGEMSFTPGFDAAYTEILTNEMGNWITLPEK